MQSSSLIARLSLAFFCLFGFVTGAKSQSAPAGAPKGIEWHTGPMVADLGGVGKIEVPKGMQFADGAGARRLLELNQNPPSGNEVGVMMPVSKPGAQNAGWIMLFEFHEVGYVSDSDKSSIDANAILESLKKGTEEANETRKKNGWTPFHVTGWEKQPFYDERTHNLTWAIDGKEDGAKPGDTTVNYSVRILGRRGEMAIDLVLGPEQLPTAVPTFNSLLDGFSYTSGNRYAEFMKGDKVAGYGLTALIAGGAAAAAVKTGLFAKFLALLAAMWKLIAVAFAAIASRFRMLLEWVKGIFRPAVKRAEEDKPAQRVLPSGEDAGDRS
jgi:uncharacterized membrane-anchored protein